MRISVKREEGKADIPAGAVSNWLHRNVKVGDILQVSHPFGDFLVRGGYVSLEQLQHALEVQRARFQRLGDVIVAHGLVSEPTLRALLAEQSPAA